MNLVATNLVVKDGVLNILRDSRDGLDIVATFFVTLDADATIERVRLILDLPQITKED